MKKLAVLAAIVLTAAQPVFAGTSFEGESARAMKSFTAAHPGIDGVWNTENNYSEVLYFWHCTIMDSYYDNNGNLIGTFHSIEPAALPAGIRAKIASWYKGYEITSVTVMSKDDEEDVTYVKVQSPRHVRILEVKADGDINEFKTLR